MILYKIRVLYETGNSFGSHKEVESVEHRWSNLKIAIENLARIKEHYIWYKWENSYKFDKSVFYEKPAFVNSNDETSILLKLDDGTEMYSQCFWCGYFEEPEYAKIELDSPNTEINF